MISTAAPVCVKLSALEAGQLTLPERLFVTDADPEKRATVPSLAFLVQHSGKAGSGVSVSTNLVFDLRVKRDLTGYAPAQRDHIKHRQPVITSPDCGDILRKGGLDPGKDIDLVILSHVHWDHIGTPQDFTKAQFISGSGTLHLLREGAGPLYPAEIFNDDELPHDRTQEFLPVTGSGIEDRAAPTERQVSQRWKQFGGFPASLDLFDDGSVWVVDALGHLIGHVNLLVRVEPERYVYLGSDCCHDPRILRGEKGIALYDDGRGAQRSVHWNTGVASKTLDRIRTFLREQRIGDTEPIALSVIVAHDKEWKDANPDRFWPGYILSQLIFKQNAANTAHLFRATH